MNDMFYAVSTRKPVAQAIEELSDALGQRQFGVLWDLDINQKLVEKGLEPEPPFHILEVCSAPRAKHALSNNQEVGYFLPCKIVVYEDRASGGTTIGFPKPDALMGLLRDPSLESLAEEVNSIMKAALDEVAAH